MPATSVPATSVTSTSVTSTSAPRSVGLPPVTTRASAHSILVGPGLLLVVVGAAVVVGVCGEPTSLQ